MFPSSSSLCSPLCACDQSWGALNFSWATVAQTQFPNVANTNPTFGEMDAASYVAIRSRGLTEASTGVAGDFDGLMVVYRPALAGPFSGSGGWGQVNGVINYQVRWPERW
jgi:hypothetical protein